MRFFEVTLLVLAVILPLYISQRKYSLNKKKVLIFVGVVVFFHFILENYRWQMLFIYIIILVLLWYIFKEYYFFKGNWFRKLISGFVLSLFIVLGWLLPTVLPVFTLPTPTGNYKIGSQYLHLKTDREEKITPDKSDKRELMIKVWYPAKLKDEKKELYLNQGDRVGFASKYGLPKYTFNYLNAVKTNTYKKPKVAEGKFPVLIFSHGSYSKASGYYSIIEEIVSHGYIVFNINHTYESVGALFPNKEIKLYNLEYDREKISTQEMTEMAWKSTQNYNNAKNEVDRLKVSKNILKNYIASEITERWVKDIEDVVSLLTTWDKISFLEEHIENSKIGVIGHSQGGAAAGQVLLENDKILAAINLDGIQWGKMIDTTHTKPFMHFSSDWKNNHPNFNKYAYRGLKSPMFYDLKLNNSGHSNFMDIPLIIKIPQVNEAGSINVNEATEIISEVVISFFDRYLKNKNLDILELPVKYPLLEIKKRN